MPSDPLLPLAQENERVENSLNNIRRKTSNEQTIVMVEIARALIRIANALEK